MNSQTYAEKARLLNPIDDDFLKKMAESSMWKCRKKTMLTIRKESAIMLPASRQT